MQKKSNYLINANKINIKNQISLLLIIPNKLDIVKYLKEIYHNDNHRGISSLCSELKNRLIFFRRIYIYYRKNFKELFIMFKKKFLLQIITFYPK